MDSVPRRALLLIPLLLAGLLVLGARLGPATSTETRYAEMGREMADSGDWLVPAFNGAPHLEKPPLAMWATAAAIAVLGTTDVAPRVPSIVAGLLVLLLVAAIARRLADDAEDPTVRRARGRLAALALATMPAFLVQTYTISTDIWLVLTVTAGGLALLESDRASGRPALRWTLLLHASFGVGMLVKGPLTIGLVVGSFLVVSLLRRDTHVLRPLVHPLGLLLFAALAVPWYVAVDARIPGTLDAYLHRRVLGGLASNADFHRRSIWVVWLPLVGAFPWLAAAAGSVRRLRRSGRWLRGPGLPCLALALAAPVLFSFSASRLPSYGSPALPWFAVLVALGAPLAEPTPLAGSAFSWWGGLRIGVVGVALVTLGIGAWAVVVRGAPAGLASLAVLGGAIALLAAGTGLRGGMRRRLRAAAMATAGLVLAAGAALANAPLRIPALRPVWETVQSHRLPGEELGVLLPYAGDWGLLPWYAGPGVRFFDFPSSSMVVDPTRWRPDLFLPKQALRSWFSARERRWLLVRVKEAPSLLPADLRHVVTKAHGYEVLTNQALPHESPQTGS